MNRKAPKELGGVPQSQDPLTVAVTQQRAKAPANPVLGQGRQTIEFDPTKTLIIAITIEQDTLIGQTELLTQSYGHGAKKHIVAGVKYNTFEDGKLVMKDAKIQNSSGPGIRHTISGQCTKIVSESKVLNV